MKKRTRILFMGLCFTFLVALFAGTALPADPTTIMGTVNDDYQIVTDDETVYEVAENEKGEELVKLVGKKVKVTGMVEESEEMKIIIVTAYEIMGD